MATEKTDRLEAFVVDMMGPFPAAEAPADNFPDWVQVCGHLRWLCQNATEETEGFAIGYASGPMFGWGLATKEQIAAIVEGTAPFAPAGSGEASAAVHKAPHRPDAAKLADALADFRRRVAHILGR